MPRAPTASALARRPTHSRIGRSIKLSTADGGEELGAAGGGCHRGPAAIVLAWCPWPRDELLSITEIKRPSTCAYTGYLHNITGIRVSRHTNSGKRSRSRCVAGIRLRKLCCACNIEACSQSAGRELRCANGAIGNVGRAHRAGRELRCANRAICQFGRRNSAGSQLRRRDCAVCDIARHQGGTSRDNALIGCEQLREMRTVVKRDPQANIRVGEDRRRYRDCHVRDRSVAEENGVKSLRYGESDGGRGLRAVHARPVVAPVVVVPAALTRANLNWPEPSKFVAPTRTRP